jgi:hypothetical protein
MSTKKKVSVYQIHSKPILIFIGTLLFIGIYTLSMFVPIIGGYTSYPIAMLRCGKEPVATARIKSPSGQPISYTYNVPNWKYTYKDYVCTPQEAQALDDREVIPERVKSQDEIEECMNRTYTDDFHPSRETCEKHAPLDPSGRHLVD